MIFDSIQVPEEDVTVYNFKKENGLVGLMDCGGSNLVKIHEQIPGIVRLIATARINHPDVKAKEVSRKLGVPLIEMDLKEHEKLCGVEKGDYSKALRGQNGLGTNKMHTAKDVITTRNIFFNNFALDIINRMKEYSIPVDVPFFAAGFMQLIPVKVVNSFFIVNVHPGNLVRQDLKTGKRIYTGDGWVPSAKALACREEELYSSTHLMTEEEDAGPIFMRGYPLPIDYNLIASKFDLSDKQVRKDIGSLAQETLKHIGDHVIAGATFQDLFDGKWALYKDEKTLAYKYNKKWYLAPNGIKIQDHVANTDCSTFSRTPYFLDQKIEEFYTALDKLRKTYDQNELKKQQDQSGGN